jgi:hypothetical protein
VSAPVCFLDTETLGLDPDFNPVWEVGLILPSGEEVEFQIQVTDRDISLAHPKALEISGFHDRYNARAAVHPAYAASRLWLYIESGTHIVGAVPSFDEERLRRLMWHHGRSPRWHYHLIDVEALAAGFVAGSSSQGGFDHIEEPPWDSEYLSGLVGVNPDQFARHTALGDARWARAIYRAVMGKPST